MVLTFWISFFIIFYTFIGYGILVFVLVKMKHAIHGRSTASGTLADLPSLTIIVAAYNEEEIIERKIQNTLWLTYPPGKCSYIFVTDGSNDNTPSLISAHKQIKLMHSPERGGKIGAIHRAMAEVSSEIVVFTDANTTLNEDALINIASHYSDARVGAVAGEKRVSTSGNTDATAGEGIYWKYESFLKKLDSELHTVVGAAGELFSIRTTLYQPVSSRVILDDFVISLLIAEKNYKVVYEPKAYSIEHASANIREELKRKVRIAAGGIQAIIWLRKLLNPFLHPVLSFQYISHRVLRWSLTPFCLILVFFMNILIVIQNGGLPYQLFLAAQIIFYGAAAIGWMFERKEIKIKIFFVPFYFCLMNYAVIRGIKRYYSDKQSSIWEKAKRKSVDGI